MTLDPRFICACAPCRLGPGRSFLYEKPDLIPLADAEDGMCASCRKKGHVPMTSRQFDRYVAFIEERERASRPPSE